MAIVDANGRLFGRLNLLDAVLALFVLGLVPLGYGAYVLFRTPAPVLVGVEPEVIPFSPELRVTIRGENLRPYMRVSFGDQQGRTFLFKSVTEAEVDILGLAPGVYDVVLYDFAQERSRLPKALTIAQSPVPPRQTIVVGMLANLTRDQAKQVTVGTPLAGLGEVLQVGDPVPEITRLNTGRVVIEIPVASAVRVPMTIRMPCAVRVVEGRADCVVGDVVLQPDSVLSLPTPLGNRPFQIDQVRGPQPLETVTVRVRLAAGPGALDQVKPGDADVGLVLNELAAGARVTAASPSTAGGRDIELRLQAQQTSAGWTYLGTPLRIGGAFELRTPQYEVSGTVLSLTPP